MAKEIFSLPFFPFKMTQVQSSASSITQIDVLEQQQSVRQSLPTEMGLERDRDVEAQKRVSEHASHFSLVFDQVHVTKAVLDHQYKGSGTEDDSYVVEFIPGDRRNPMNWPDWKKWAITMLIAVVCILSCAIT